MSGDLAVALLILAAACAAVATAASALRRPRPRLWNFGSGDEPPHRQAIQHFASGVLPPWR